MTAPEDPIRCVQSDLLQVWICIDLLVPGMPSVLLYFLEVVVVDKVPVVRLAELLTVNTGPLFPRCWPSTTLCILWWITACLLMRSAKGTWFSRYFDVVSGLLLLHDGEDIDFCGGVCATQLFQSMMRWWSDTSEKQPFNAAEGSRTKPGL